jgi:MSHA biogenesis protein MshJ
MDARLVKLQEAIDGRVMRERALIFLTLLASVFMIWNFMLQAPLDNDRKKYQAELAAIATERKNTETQITSLSMAVANSPVILKRKEIAQLNEKIDEVEVRLAAMSQGLISADQLPQMLEAMLKKIGELELVSIQTLPASELQLLNPQPETVNNTTSTGAAELQDTGVYKHMVVVRIAGGYFQLVELLAALEGLSWKFYWEALDYRVDHYPQAEIELRVFTLSSEEGLLGV